MVVEELEILIKANIKDAMSGLEKVSTAVKNAVSQTLPVANQVANATTRTVNASKGFKNATNNIHQFTNAMKSTVVQQTALERKINDINNILSNPKSKELFSTQEIFDMQLEVEKLNNKLANLQKGTIEGKATNSIKGMQKEFNKLGSGFERGIRSVRRFALALFSVESIYSMLSRFAHAFIAQNEELGNKIKYLEYSLGSALAPVITFIVNEFAKALTYVGAIIKVLTGVNIFAGSYASYMKSANKSSAGTAKNINKQLSSIDEINNIGGASAGGGVGGGNVATPDFNLEEQTNKLATFSKKVQEIAKAFDFVWESAKMGWAAFVVGFEATFLVLVETLNGIIYGALEIIFGTIKGLFDALYGIGKGFYLAIEGTVKGIIEIVDGLNKTIYGILVGLFEGIWQIGKSVFEGIIGFIKGVFTGDFKGAFESIVNMFKGIWNGIKTIGLSIFWGLFDGIKGIFNGIVTFGRGLFDGFVAILTGLVKGVGNVFIGIINGVINVINGVIKGINWIRIPDWVPVIGGRSANISYVPKLNYFAKGGVIDSPTLGVMGEYSNARSNPEIISPQSIMRQTFLDALKEQGGNDGTIIVNVGNKQLYKGTIEELKRQSYLKNGMEVSLA